ncbi:hypothetical protein [Breoghania corrubedonensis]|uniref:hypothetical protein n=1 Tax=Breoghania corrubedonensis TaxID=665038 RepID=UPI001AECE6F7|nr:hypothetical protein [Breoghania corrubedonensis]
MIRLLPSSGLALAALAAFLVPASAATDCTCRVNGTRFELGAITCIHGPRGNRLAQCQMNLNNTSWKVLSNGCPTAMLVVPHSPPPHAPASSASAPDSAR